MMTIVTGQVSGRTVRLAGWAGGVTALGFVSVLASSALAQNVKPVAAAVEPARAGCDADCARQAIPSAVQACAPSIERQAPTDFEWMSRPAGTIFQQAEPPGGTESVVKFRGDSIRFLSPQGQWVRITYECDYDTATQAVRNVKVRLGRIDGKGANVGAPARPAAGGPAPAELSAPAATQAKRPPKPSEPSEVEVRQVAPSSR